MAKILFGAIECDWTRKAIWNEDITFHLYFNGSNNLHDRVLKLSSTRHFMSPCWLPFTWTLMNWNNETKRWPILILIQYYQLKGGSRFVNHVMDIFSLSFSGRQIKIVTCELHSSDLFKLITPLLIKTCTCKLIIC